MIPREFEKPDSGRRMFRLPGEPKDERPCVLYRSFWRSVEEKAAYLEAVRNHPREVDPDRDEIESSMAYIARLAGIVAKKPLPRPEKPMPRADGSHWAVPYKEPGYEERLDAIYTRDPGEEG